MKPKILFAFSLFIVYTVNGCLPSSLETEVFTPKSQEGQVHSLKELLSDYTPLDSIDDFNENIAVVGMDSMLIFFILWEMEDIYLMDVFFRNDSFRDRELPLRGFNLFENNFTLKRLLPDEAANIFIKKVKDIPPYQPKYSYEIETKTKGRIDYFGNYSEKTKSTITTKEDPFTNIGYAIGSIIQNSKNKKFQERADDIYKNGFIEIIEVPAFSIAGGGMYWLKKQGIRPLKLRIGKSDIEIEFVRNK